MPQGVKIALGLIFLVALLIFNTPITRVGSGFIIDKGKYVFTYTGLVTGSKSISIKFPNEENIQAKSIYVDRESNIAILKMDKKCIGEDLRLVLTKGVGKMFLETTCP